MISTPLGRLFTVISAACPITGLSGSQANLRIDYDPGATPAQKTAAANALAAFDWTQTAQDAWQLTQDRANAIALFIADPSPSSKVLRGAILALVDQLNVIRAALPTPLAAITVSQARAAIQTKINGGTVD